MGTNHQLPFLHMRDQQNNDWFQRYYGADKDVVTKDAKSWDDAQASCKEVGGHLAIIKSPEEVQWYYTKYFMGTSQQPGWNAKDGKHWVTSNNWEFGRGTYLGAKSQGKTKGPVYMDEDGFVSALI